ncbi:MAG: ABC-F family ATP-binding cassette domain-containing protein [Clostridiales bacterium]|nr:ABC-F family ATP-binding cassette domain-containing protein [Clostridiales bacterium]
MPVLSVQKLNVSFGDKIVIADASFDLEKGDRAGLIGPNGSGKTTLFNCITGGVTPDSGMVVLPAGTVVGRVEQHACADPDMPAYEEALTVFADLAAEEERLALLPALIESAGGEQRDALIAEMTALTDDFRLKDGLTYKARTRAALLGLGLSDAEIALPTGKLSGGQRTKVALAKLLLSSADLILLDEPTNHLDLMSIEWLEDFLGKYRGTALIVSHDRRFLDDVTNKTVEISSCRVWMTGGGYTRHMELKAERQEHIRREYEKTTAEIKRLEAVIDQQRTFSMERNFITIASKRKQIDRLKATLVAPEKPLREMHLDFPVSRVSGNEVLSVSGISKSFDGKQMFRDVSFDLRRGDRVFLAGPNGCGKTTLISIITGRLPADEGSVRWGAGVIPGYYEQSQRGLMSRKTALDEVYGFMPSLGLAQSRQYMASFLFSEDDVYKHMDELSGGERAKIGLLEVMLKGPNLLILDEPTNHLDIRSREILEEALRRYTGTVLCVSHDRMFMERLATKIYVFSGGTLREASGAEEYAGIFKQLAVKEKREPKVNEYELRKQRDSEERKRQTKIKRTEEEIAALEREEEELQAALADPQNAADYIKAAELSGRIAAVAARRDELMELWLELGEQ